MKSRLAAILTVFAMCSCAAAGNYTLTVDGKRYDIDLGKQKLVKLADGRNLRLTLEKKAIASFKTATFSFDHPSRFSPFRTDLGSGVHQTTMVSPLGTIVIAQDLVSEVSPALVDVLLNELTKDAAQAGHKITTRPTARRLADGTRLTGKLAVSKSKELTLISQVLLHHKRDACVLVATQCEKNSPRREKQIIDLFWKTLKVTLR